MVFKQKYILSFLTLFFLSFYTRAQLVINEVSQGYSGNQEYVELLVVGTPNCSGIPTMDLRGYYIDDNNGTYATGAGTGIAQGCVRFTTDPLWSAVPVGTLILIYNDADLNPDVPAQDLSLSDGNCKLVIPISNCTLFEKHASQPSTATSTYPTSGLTACGNWTNISMANGGDSFQTVTPGGAPVFSVSWGNNTLSNIIYFAPGQTGMVCSMTNSTNNNPFTQSNWVSQTVTGNQTPGAPNNAANAAWINSMNNSCSLITPLVANTSVTNAVCVCNGSATVTASGAIGPYTYTWSPTGGNAATATGLCAGNYSVDVTSANGCLQTLTLTIGSTSPLTVTAASSQVSCNGGSNGSATITPSNGTGGYTYTWTPGGNSGATASGLSAGTYTVNVADGVGCSLTTTVSVSEPGSMSVTATQTNVTCNGGSNGTLAATVSGGTGAYTYTWSPTGGNSSSASGLTAGIYTLTVQDANNCAAAATYSLTEPATLTTSISSTSVSCNGGSNGSANVIASGGTGPYNYTWTPGGSNASNATSLPAGNYSVVVGDANGCLATNTTMINEPSAITVSISNASSSCGLANASATAAVNGGTAPYSYTWSPGGNSGSVITNLSAGNYTVAITDNNGCVATATTTIANISGATVSLSATAVACNGSSNGTATCTANGGTAPLTYTWLPTGGNSAIASGLSAGVYTATVTDNLGCISSNTITIGQPSVITATLTSSNILCFGGSSGSIIANANGGAGAYTYSWSPVGGTTSTASNLSAGAYTLSVTDANGCSGVFTSSVNQPPLLAVSTSTTAALCNGGNTGSATALPSGGTGPYNYSWNPSGISTATISNQFAGTYTVQVTDDNGCLQSATAIIPQPTAISLTVTTMQATCGGSNGSANATASGGTGTYNYNWLPMGTNQPGANNLPAITV